MAKVNMAELEDFVLRAEEVQKQVEAIIRGDVVPPSSESAASRASAASKAAAAASAEEDDRANIARWNAQGKERRRVEERERWWALAKMQFDGGESADAASSSSGAPAAKHYTGSDYRKWEQWRPDDPVTLAETRDAEAARQKAQDDAFEKANPGFVAAFTADVDKRNAADRVKAEKAEALKARANEAFAAKQYEVALARYHAALELAPFNVAVLNNICQAHLSSGDSETDVEEAIEFASRCLRVDPRNVKALYRRSMAYIRRLDWSAAIADLERALALDAKNADVRSLLETARLEAAEAAKEAALAVAAAAPATAAVMQPVLDIHALLAALVAAVPRSSGAAAASGTLLTWDGDSLRRVAADMTDDRHRVLLRSTGVLEALIRGFTATMDAIATYSDTPSSTSTGASSVYLNPTALAPAALLLAASTDNPKNRQLVLAAHCLNAACAVVALPDERVQAACKWLFSLPLAGMEVSEHRGAAFPMQLDVYVPATTSALLSVIDVYARASASVEAHGIIMSSPLFAAATSGSVTLPQRIDAAARALASKEKYAVAVQDCAGACAAIVQHLALQAAASDASHELQSTFVRLCTPSAAAASRTLVAVLLGYVAALTARSIIDPALLTGYYMQTAVGALANLAQLPAARKEFFVSSARPAAHSAAAPPCPAAALLSMLCIPWSILSRSAASVASAAAVDVTALEGEWNVIRASVLGALANALLGVAEGMAALASSDAGAQLVAILTGASAPGTAEAAGDAMKLPQPSITVAGRSALLLGRLCTNDTVVSQLAQPSNIRSLVQLLQSPPRATAADGASASGATAQLQDGLVRVLAAAVRPSHPACITAFLDADGCTVLATLVTAQVKDVRDPSSTRSRIVSMSNAALLSGVLADDVALHARMLGAGLCDALVEALKAASSSTDANGKAALKNTGSALAKLARTAECAARIRELRGIEILMQLSSQIL